MDGGRGGDEVTRVIWAIRDHNGVCGMINGGINGQFENVTVDAILIILYPLVPTIGGSFLVGGSMNEIANTLLTDLQLHAKITPTSGESQRASPRLVI